MVVTFLGISFSAVAIDYTAKSSRHGSKNQKEVSQKADKNKCSGSDMRAIKKFDRKAKSEIEEWYERNEFSNQIVRGTTGHTEYELIKIAKKVDVNELVSENFFVSEEYIAMKVVYDRCDLKPPMIKLPDMIMLPEAFR